MAVVGENYSEKPLKLLKMFKEITVPSISFYKVVNALVMLARRGFISRDEEALKFNYIDSIPTLLVYEVSSVKAVELAMLLNITLYDPSYLRLAIEAKTALITADKDLYEAGRRAAEVIHIPEKLISISTPAETNANTAYAHGSIAWDVNPQKDGVIPLRT
jgi:predicted nucleic acid-binding protein